MRLPIDVVNSDTVRHFVLFISETVITEYGFTFTWSSVNNKRQAFMSTTYANIARQAPSIRRRDDRF